MRSALVKQGLAKRKSGKHRVNQTHKNPSENISPAIRAHYQSRDETQNRQGQDKADYQDLIIYFKHEYNLYKAKENSGEQ